MASRSFPLYTVLSSPFYLLNDFVFLDYSHERSLRSLENSTLKIPAPITNFYSYTLIYYQRHPFVECSSVEHKTCTIYIFF